MVELLETVEKALSLAKGKWQRDLVNFGLLELKGWAARWRGKYIASARNFVERLNRNGVPSTLHIHRSTVGVILGQEWVEAFELLRQLRQEALSVASTLKRFAQDSKTARRLRGRGELRRLAAGLRREMEWLIELNQSFISAIYNEDALAQALIQASMRRALLFAREESERTLNKWRNLAGADNTDEGGEEKWR